MKLIPTIVSMIMFVLCGVALYYSHPGVGSDPDVFRVISAIGVVAFGISLIAHLVKLADPTAW